MKVSEFQTWFPHPEKSDTKIYIIFDACHMIKLMRNLLGDYKMISHEINSKCQNIKWQYIEDLNTLQEDIRFTIANKLKHIMWRKHKMNVSMAAQTQSSSVASNIDFFWDEMEVPEF